MLNHWNFTIILIEKVSSYKRLQNTFKRNKGCKNNHQLCYPCTNIPQTTKIDPYPYANNISLFNMDIGVIKDICCSQRLDKNLLSVRND